MTRRYIYLGICWHDLEPFVFEHSKGLVRHRKEAKTSWNLGILESWNLLEVADQIQDIEMSRYLFLRRCIPRNPRSGVNKEWRTFNCVNVKTQHSQ
ncbi:uncharacterized protein Bfra_004818 [Botrytis fragariae]|uniref:Uncharacterized protein n=1 Tax=Botrytis fragariae TaxID=1964551 RepID=A0A8H6EIQ4_9HELO|nr:uncharacterized protein Bfra_004818 [Botrytis fragariae]KAF5873360.1 hypothetical protein Bfra_004818 [Botrytis fragariae]